jgi:hypothetical protein
MRAETDFSHAHPIRNEPSVWMPRSCCWNAPPVGLLVLWNQRTGHRRLFHHYDTTLCPGLTAWLPQPCRQSCTNEATMS